MSKTLLDVLNEQKQPKTKTYRGYKQDDWGLGSFFAIIPDQPFPGDNIYCCIVMPEGMTESRKNGTWFTMTGHWFDPNNKESAFFAHTLDWDR